MRQIGPLIDSTEHAAEEINKATKQTRQAADRLYNTCKEARDEINKATENSSHKISSIFKNVKGDICKVTEELHTATTQPKDLREKGRNDKGMKNLYTDALSRQLPMTHARTLARNCTCNRQIIIDK